MAKLHVQGDGTEPIFIAETSGGSNTFQVLEDGSFAIADGITAPSSATGLAKIYIDSADGDLKIIFSDGTVKTITTDT